MNHAKLLRQLAVAERLPDESLDGLFERVFTAHYNVFYFPVDERDSETFSYNIGYMLAYILKLTNSIGIADALNWEFVERIAEAEKAVAMELGVMFTAENRRVTAAKPLGDVATCILDKQAPCSTAELAERYGSSILTLVTAVVLEASHTAGMDAQNALQKFLDKHVIGESK